MAKKIDNTSLYLIGKLHGSMDAQESLEALLDEVFEYWINANKTFYKFRCVWNKDKGYVLAYDYTTAC